MIRRMKDRALSKALAAAVRAKIRAFGTVRELTIDTAEKSVEIVLELRGEPEPLQIVLHGYRILREQERYTLTAKRIESSREWLDIAAREYLAPLRLEIPAGYAEVIRRLL